jgi:transposase-like protein
MHETYVKVGGQWKYLYRAVDRAGNTVHFLLTAKRDRAVAQRFLTRVIGNNALPTTITIDKSGANRIESCAPYRSLEVTHLASLSPTHSRPAMETRACRRRGPRLFQLRERFVDADEIAILDLHTEEIDGM